MSKLYLNPNLQLIFCVTLMAIVSVSSIAPVLPQMAMHIHGLSPENIGLVITSFTFPGILMTPVAGILGDRLGRKAVLVPSLFFFGFFGTACFWATDLHTLLILRFLQGIGAGPLGMLNLTIIGDLFQGKERLQAMGYNAAVLSIGTALFPAIGGLMALIAWNWPFLLPVFALPLGCLVAAKLNAPIPQKQGSLAAYMKSAWKNLCSWPAITLFMITFLTFIILYGPIITYLPILMHQKFASEAPIIGMIISIASFVTALAASQLGRLSQYFPSYALMSVGFVAYLLAMLIVPHVTSQWWIILPLLFFGLGQGLNIPLIMTTIASLAPAEQRSAFMATNGMILRFSQTIAPVCMGQLFIFFGLNAIFYAGAVTALLMCCLIPLLYKIKQV